MKNKSISIIGAGIGGLSTALILKQKKFNIQVYERADQIKAVGAGILMGNNAMQVIKKTRDDLFSKFKNAGHIIKEIRMTDEKFNVLSLLDLSFFERKYGVPSLAIHRRDIHKILADEVGYDLINLGKKLDKIERKEKYILKFEDQTSIATDMIIGADGIRSEVRQQLFSPSESEYRNAHQLCWRGICKIKLPSVHNHVFYDMWGKKSRFGFARINEEEVYWYAMINESEESSKIENSELVKAFSYFHQDVIGIINATDPDKIIKGEIKDLKHIKKWYHQNTCLLGDAAHSTTPNFGQGASQAMEDAYVLGMCLEKYEIEEALVKYQELRIKKATKVVDSSWSLGKMAMMNNPMGIWMRNRMLKLVPSRVFSKNLETIFNLNYRV